MSVSYETKSTTQTVKTVGNVRNGAGYLDLKVFKRANGRAITIAKRDGSDMVNVTLASVPSLIAALQEINANGAAIKERTVSFR